MLRRLAKQDSGPEADRQHAARRSARHEQEREVGEGLLLLVDPAVARADAHAVDHHPS